MTMLPTDHLPTLFLLLCAMTTPHTTTAWMTPTTSTISMTSSSSPSPKITVVGGTGFVGSRVCRSLVSAGASVTSVSRTPNPPAWCADQSWTSSVQWKSLDLLSAADNDDDAAVEGAVGSPEVMISCVGAIGTDSEFLRRGNGDTNAAAFAGAKRGGKLRRTVLVSVASEVAACLDDGWLPGFFEGYFEGKRIAEEAARDAVEGVDGGTCTVVSPSFIYGGDSFELVPPRVTQEYGAAIEQLLSYGVFTFLGDVGPGLIGVALRPPSCVDAVAGACVKAALGDGGGEVIDGGKAINAAAEYPDSTGLTEAIGWAKDNVIEAYRWVKEKIEENK